MYVNREGYLSIVTWVNSARPCRSVVVVADTLVAEGFGAVVHTVGETRRRRNRLRLAHPLLLAVAAMMTSSETR